MSRPEPSPPRAPRRATVHVAHGRRRTDHYAWMAESDEQAAAMLDAHLAAEATHHATVVAPLAPLRAELLAELHSHLPDVDVSPVATRGAYGFFSRCSGGDQYAVHHRFPRNTWPLASTPPCPDDPAWSHVTVALDENLVATDGAEPGETAVSDDGTKVAWTVDRDGTGRHELWVRDLDTSDDRLVHPGPVSALAGFSPDATALFVTVDDELQRPHQLWRVPADGSDPVCLFDEPDPTFALCAARTRHGRVLLVCAERSGTTRWWSLDLADPAAAVLAVADPGDDVAVELDVALADDGSLSLVWVSDQDSPDGTLLSAPFDPATGHVGPATVLHTPGPGVVLCSVDAFAHHLVVSVRAHLRAAVQVVSPDGTLLCHLGAGSPDDDGTEVWWLDDEGSFDPPSLWLSVGRPHMPTELCALDLDALDQADQGQGRPTAVLDLTVLQRELVPGFVPGRYRSTRTTATAADGTAVPVTVLWHRDTPLDGTAPCVLEGYGAYGVALDPVLDPTLLPLLDRGVVVATAHLRGGGEGGRRWWDAGRLENKASTFDDFHACAHHLVDAGFARPGYVCAVGRSAGGLVAGSVVNRCDPVFGAVVADSPFVDLLNTMSDPSLPLTCGEWTEWGDPTSDPATHDRLAALSPYDNVAPAPARPHLLVCAGLSDPLVLVHEPLKWVARLREVWPTGTALVLDVTETGHCGPSGRLDVLAQVAAEQAFVLSALGVHGAPPMAAP